LQLVTIDEIAGPGTQTWHDPGSEFALLPDVDNSNGGMPFRLVDKVDYVAPHFYPETLTTADLDDGFARKTQDAREKLRRYMHAADAISKPVAIGEFGLQIAPPTLSHEQYSATRDRFFEQFLGEGERVGLQGLLVWDAIPEIVLNPGHYLVSASKLNPYSPVEIDITAEDHTRRRVLFYHPGFNLFEWRTGDVVPSASPAAKALASAWAEIPSLNRTSRPGLGSNGPKGRQ
jgi:hypothetical protein